MSVEAKAKLRLFASKVMFEGHRFGTHVLCKVRYAIRLGARYAMFGTGPAHGATIVWYNQALRTTPAVGYVGAGEEEEGREEREDKREEARLREERERYERECEAAEERVTCPLFSYAPAMLSSYACNDVLLRVRYDIVLRVPYAFNRSIVHIQQLVLRAGTALPGSDAGGAVPERVPGGREGGGRRGVRALPGTGLRACYAMSGTDIAHRAISLCVCYAMPGTDIA
eukprot:2558293-Rhodomonas_salina.2